MNKNTPSLFSRFFTRFTLTLSVGTTLGLLGCLGQLPTLAQSVNSDGYQTNEQGSLSSGSGFNPFSLIHNATLGGSQSMEEFNQSMSENLNSASNDFRRQQLEMLRRRQQGNGSPEAANESAIPEE